MPSCLHFMIRNRSPTFTRISRITGRSMRLSIRRLLRHFSGSPISIDLKSRCWTSRLAAWTGKKSKVTSLTILKRMRPTFSRCLTRTIPMQPKLSGGRNFQPTTKMALLRSGKGQARTRITWSEFTWQHTVSPCRPGKHSFKTSIKISVGTPKWSKRCIFWRGDLTRCLSLWEE